MEPLEHLHQLSHRGGGSPSPVKSRLTFWQHNASDAAGFGDPHASIRGDRRYCPPATSNWSNNARACSIRAQPRACQLSATASGQWLPANGTARQACTLISSGNRLRQECPIWPIPPHRHDFGTDGGVQPTSSAIWRNGRPASNYEGSLVASNFAQYGVGAFKCCKWSITRRAVTMLSTRTFTDPSKMPPGTPALLTVVNVDMVQDLEPR